MSTILKWFLMASMLWSAFAYANPVEIQVQNINDNRGTIFINLFAKSADWDKEVPTAVIKLSPVVLGTSTIVVDLPPGQYAFFLYNDVNNNDHLEKTALGFPNEPYAFSNNFKLGYSKPTWNDMMFRVSKTGEEAIQIVNLITP